VKALVDYEQYTPEQLNEIVTCPGCNGTGHRSTFTLYKLPCPFCLLKGTVTFYMALRAKYIMSVSKFYRNSGD
jgi:hypothetical protein